MKHNNLTEFEQKVYEIVAAIPEGSTMTYKEVAIKAGRPQSFRAVGTVLSKNYDPRIPCHRVIGSDGSLRGYNRGLNRKREILKKEGAIN